MRMRLYPRSFFEYALAALFVFALPFLAAVASMSWFVERLTVDSGAAVRAALVVGDSRRAIDAQLAQLERAAQQLQVLGDALLRERYAALHARFSQTLDTYREAVDTDEERMRLDELDALETSIAATVATAAADSSELARATVAFDRLAVLARQAGEASDAALAQRLEALQQRADRAVRTLLWGTAALLAAAVLLAVGLARALTGPVRVLDRAIRALGRGDWSRPVSARGPRDLSELADRLEWLRLRLADLERQRIGFIQHVSHDLKTPLASLREGSALLADGVMGPLSDAQREVVAIISNMSRRLERMIERLLAFAAAPPARAVDRRQVRLDELLARVAGEQKLQSTARQLTVRIDAPPARAAVDEDMLRTIVDNLLSNAIRFSPPGGTVRMELEDKPDVLRLRVSDEGPGVPQAERELVFEPFYTQPRALPNGGDTAGTDGTGLGLAIAREHARLHGGELRLVPTPRGACFELTLPRI